MMFKKADLPILSLKALADNDNVHEQARLFEICTEMGIFYLDLNESSLEEQSDAGGAGNVSGCGGLKKRNIEELLAFGKDFFGRPQPEKEDISLEKTGGFFGYKRAGNAVVDSKGTPDSSEFLNISKHDVLQHAYNPTPVLRSISTKETTATEIHSFVTSAHQTLLLILANLSRSLQLSSKDTNNLVNKHRIDQPSNSHLRFIRYAANSATAKAAQDKTMLFPHTDFGSLTLLLTEHPGLQIQHPRRDNEWLEVEPRPGLAIVNVGDTLAKFTNGVFHACRHRVVVVPVAASSSNSDDQLLAVSTKDKYSIVYFLRPGDNVTLRTVESPLVPKPEEGEEQGLLTKDWIAKRVSAGKAAPFRNKRDWEILRGRA